MSDKAASFKTRSRASCSSARSSVASASSAAAKARAKAEAAKARLTFAGKEMNLKMERAKIDASIELLQCEKDVASAVAEAEALEAAVCSQNDTHSIRLDPDPSLLESAQRTEQYVKDQAKIVSIEEAAVIGEPTSSNEIPPDLEQEPSNIPALNVCRSNCSPSLQPNASSERPICNQNLPVTPSPHLTFPCHLIMPAKTTIEIGHVKHH